MGSTLASLNDCFADVALRWLEAINRPLWAVLIGSCDGLPRTANPSIAVVRHVARSPKCTVGCFLYYVRFDPIKLIPTPQTAFRNPPVCSPEVLRQLVACFIHVLSAGTPCKIKPVIFAAEGINAVTAVSSAVQTRNGMRVVP